MKKIISILLILMCINLLFNDYKVAYGKENNTNITILIDPGHGGVDGGAVAKDGTQEKDINLQISLKLRDELKKENYNVIMTREKDEGLYDLGKSIKEKKVQDLTKRSKMQDETNCDVFISIHQNMFPQEKYKGAQVWYASNDKSKKLAEVIQSVLKSDIDESNNRMAKPAKNMYKILRGEKKCACIIVECGFMSNIEEEKKLKDDKYQQKIAETIKKGVEEYLKNNYSLEK